MTRSQAWSVIWLSIRLRASPFRAQEDAARRRGKGKSGGYRTITFFSGDDLPLFLITVFSKGERSDLSKSERNRLHTITKAIVAEYRQKAALTKKGG
jgi:hypothetical protein